MYVFHGGDRNRNKQNLKLCYWCEGFCRVNTFLTFSLHNEHFFVLENFTVFFKFGAQHNVSVKNITSLGWIKERWSSVFLSCIEIIVYRSACFLRSFGTSCKFLTFFSFSLGMSRSETQLLPVKLKPFDASCIQFILLWSRCPILRFHKLIFSRFVISAASFCLLKGYKNQNSW